MTQPEVIQCSPGRLQASPVEVSAEALRLLEALPEKYRHGTGNAVSNLNLLYIGLRSAQDGVLVTASNGSYRVSIAPLADGLVFKGVPPLVRTGVMLLENLAKPGFPVSSGYWMDYYEPYMKEYGVRSEARYKKLSMVERAQVEVQRQVDEYETAENSKFPEQFARTYHPEEWERWMDANRGKDGYRIFWSKKSIDHWRTFYNLRH